MRTANYKQAAATPGWAAAASQTLGNNAKPSAGTAFVRSCKCTKDSSFQQEPTLFDEAGEPSAAREEMAVFFDTIRPHLEGLKAADRMSVLSCLYWYKAGEDRETLSALLRKPLRAVFEGIIDKLKN